MNGAWRGGTGARRAMLGVVIAGITGLAVLTKLSLDAHRLQQRTATSLMEGLAARIAARFMTDIETELYIGATAVFSRAGLGRMGGARPAASADAIARAVVAVAECKCAPVFAPTAVFTADLVMGTLRITPMSGQEGPTLSIERLRGEFRARLADGGWDFAVASEPTLQGGVVFFSRVPGDTAILMGFVVDSVVMRQQIVSNLFSRRASLLAQSGLSTADSSFVALRVAFPGGAPLGRFGELRERHVVGTASLPALFGGWRVEAALDLRTAAEAVGAPLGRSPLPLLVVLASLAGVALLVAYGAARRSAELAAARATLISGMSHELRTPLTEILLVAESIQRGQFHDRVEVSGAVDVVVREARRLLRLIGNVLEMSVSGTPRPWYGAPRRLGGEIRRIVDDFALLAASHRATVTVRVDDDDQVMADVEGVRQILLNFLDNACRYGDAGQHIVVVLRRNGGRLRLEVIDQGAGLATEHRDAVWLPFVRGPAMAGHERTGSGLGLAVVRQIAEQHGAITGLAPNPSGGTVAYVEFPVLGHA